jgi:hypothetical protein
MDSLSLGINRNSVCVPMWPQLCQEFVLSGYYINVGSGEPAFSLLLNRLQYTRTDIEQESQHFQFSLVKYI